MPPLRPAPLPLPRAAARARDGREGADVVEAKQVYGMQWAKFSSEKQLILRGELAKE